VYGICDLEVDNDLPRDFRPLTGPDRGDKSQFGFGDL
jgi:hypothetical protein